MCGKVNFEFIGRAVLYSLFCSLFIVCTSCQCPSCKHTFVPFVKSSSSMGSESDGEGQSFAGAYQAASEEEPNNSITDAQTLEPGSSVKSRVGFDSDLEDWYVIEAPSYGKLSISVKNLEDADVNHGTLAGVPLFNDEQKALAHAGIKGGRGCWIAPQERETSQSISTAPGEVFYVRVTAGDPNRARYLLEALFTPSRD